MSSDSEVKVLTLLIHVDDLGMMTLVIGLLEIKYMKTKENIPAKIIANRCLNLTSHKNIIINPLKNTSAAVEKLFGKIKRQTKHRGRTK